MDPKKVELSTYKSLVGYHLITAPNLDEYVMTTSENAVGILESAISEMEDRFQIFSETRVRNIKEYQEKRSKNDSLKEIPYIIVIIDELSDQPDDLQLLKIELQKINGFLLVLSKKLYLINVDHSTIKKLEEMRK